MLEKFYRAVLPDQGHFALFLQGSKRHVWCPDIESLTRETEKRIDQQGIYFATGTFAEPTERTIENALYRRAFCFDIDAGPEKYAKHGDKVYPTQRDAVAGLMTWIGTSGIKPGWIVSSGAGLHVYIVLRDAVPVADWDPIAKALKAMALFQGLRIDPAVTGDAARILRPPGTPHSSGARVAVLKRGPQEYHLDDLRAASAGFAPSPAPRRVSANDIFLKPTYNGPPRSADKLVKNCAAVGHVAAMRGDVEEPYWRATLGILKHCENGEAAGHALSEGDARYDPAETQDKLDRWTAGPTTCETFEGFNAQACAGCKFRGRFKSPIILAELNDDEVAARPPAPQPEAPAEVQQEDAEDGGWSSDDDGSAPAAQQATAEPGAPHTGPWDGHLPPNFFIAPDDAGGHRVMHRKAVQAEDETATPKPDGSRPKKTVFVDVQFAAVPFWFESWAAGTHDGDQAMTVYCVFDKFQQRVSRFTLPTKNVASRDALLGSLAAQNVQVYPSTLANKQSMEDYVKASIERIRLTGQRQKVLARFGNLHDDKGNLVVAHGKYLIKKDGSISEGVVSDMLKSMSLAYVLPLPVTNTGDWRRQDWLDSHALPLAKKHVGYLREFYSDDNFKPYQLAIMLAWASPFMCFTRGDFLPGGPLPGFGMSVSLYSTLSGIGKTACMQAAALAFGAPNGLIQQLDRRGSTNNARQHLVAVSGTMPTFLDEMEDVEAEEMANLISAIGNGQPKMRLKPTLEIVASEKFSLINIMSTNKSHRELVVAARDESNAVQNRLLEINCTGVKPVSVDVSSRESVARLQIQDCAGAVGSILHAVIASLGSAQLNKLGLDCALEARALLAGDQEERIAWRALGAMLLMRRILRKVSRDLDVFDDKALVAECKHWMAAGKEFNLERVIPANGAAQMSMFLTESGAHTLVTRKAGTADKLEVPLNDRIPDDVHARVMLDGTVLVRVDALRAWATKRKLSYRGLVKMCIDEEVVRPGYQRKDGRTETLRDDLRKGTKLATGVRVPVLSVSLAALNGIDLSGSSADVIPLHNRPATAEQSAEPPRTAAGAE